MFENSICIVMNNINMYYSRGAQAGISGFTRARQINIKGGTLHLDEYIYHILALNICSRV